MKEKKNNLSYKVETKNTEWDDMWCSGSYPLIPSTMFYRYDEFTNDLCNGRNEIKTALDKRDFLIDMANRWDDIAAGRMLRNLYYQRQLDLQSAVYEDRHILIRDASFSLTRRALCNLYDNFRDHVDFRSSLSTNCLTCCELWNNYIVDNGCEKILGKEFVRILEMDKENNNLEQMIIESSLRIVEQCRLRFARIPDDKGDIGPIIESEISSGLGTLCRHNVMVPFLTQIKQHMKENFERWDRSTLIDFFTS